MRFCISNVRLRHGLSDLIESQRQRGQPVVCLSRALPLATVALCGLLGVTVPATSADLGPQPRESLAEPAPPPSQWQFSFTPYLWLPWISGNMVVKGRGFDVAVDPSQLLDHL